MNNISNLHGIKKGNPTRSPGANRSGLNYIGNDLGLGMNDATTAITHKLHGAGAKH